MELLNNSELLYSVLFDFTEPWKVDMLEFLDENYWRILQSRRLPPTHCK